MISAAYACRCGVETPCAWKDLNLGRVFQCPACKEVAACVYPQGGGREWVVIEPAKVRFHNLVLDNPAKIEDS